MHITHGEYICTMHSTCMKYNICTMHGTSMEPEYTSAMHGICMKYICTMHGTCMHEIHQCYAWNMPVLCMDLCMVHA